MADDGQIMGDEDERQIELSPELREEVEDRRLHGDVQCRDRLVGDEDVGLQGEGARDSDALPLAAGETARVGTEQRRRQFNELEKLARARLI